MGPCGSCIMKRQAPWLPLFAPACSLGHSSWDWLGGWAGPWTPDHLLFLKMHEIKARLPHSVRGVTSRAGLTGGPWCHHHWELNGIVYSPVGLAGKIRSLQKHIFEEEKCRIFSFYYCFEWTYKTMYFIIRFSQIHHWALFLFVLPTTFPCPSCLPCLFLSFPKQYPCFTVINACVSLCVYRHMCM